MALVSDLLLDENYDLLINNGDFVVGPSDQQSILIIANTTLGSYKQFPLLGLQIINYSASSGNGQSLSTNLRSQLTTDGFRVNSINIDTSDGVDQFTFTIDANRINGI